MKQIFFPKEILIGLKNKNNKKIILSNKKLNKMVLLSLNKHYTTKTKKTNSLNYYNYKKFYI